MSTHKHFDRICCIILTVVLVLSVLFMSGEAFGIQPASRVMGYESRLFDFTRVHTIDIVADDWDGFLQTCTDEEYITCAAVIDGEAYRNIAIRAKGNTSLSSVKNYGNDRYSFKLEFDHYDSSLTYHGLDKLCLNNIIQDNTYMKDFIVYQMMLKAGVSAPLCSFAYITVNGEDWGLYLAVEAVEDSFLQRNYGSDYGELYKPDSMSFGGGRGNGRDFDMDRFREDNSDIFGGDAAAENSTENATVSQFGGMAPPEMPNGMAMPEMGEEGTVPEMPDGASAPDNTMQQGGFRPDKGGMGRGDKGGMGGMGSSDVKLQYTDDDPDSYTNIFSSAKTDETDADEQRLIAALKALSEGDTSSVFTEDVIKYFVVHLFVCNGDSYTGNMIHNYYLYEDGGQLAMLPWDYNLAFGAFDGNDASSAVNAPIDTPVSGGIGEDRPMISWVFSDDAYLQQYHEFYSSFLSEVIDSGWADELISDTAELIAPYVEKDPTKFCTYEEFTKGVEALRSFIALRAQSVRGQLDGSIPSTTEGQNGSTALVDASSVNISDMGSMGKMGGHDNMDNMDNMGGFGGFGGNGGRPSREEQEDTAPLAPSEGAEDSTESDIPQDDVAQNVAPPDMPQGGFGGQMPPDMPQSGFGGQTPPDMPQGGFGGQTPPDMPQGGFGGQIPPDMQGNTIVA